MKYRLDLVTNSSSSSYVCDICGRTEEGMDLGLSEAEMYECVNGHTFCEDEITMDFDFKEIFKNEMKDEWFAKNCKDLVDKFNNGEFDDDDLEDICFDNFELRYQLPEEYCPICNFSVIINRDIKDYLYEKYKVESSEVLTYIKTINKRRKKVYDNDYIEYVCKQNDTTVDATIAEIKATFDTYKKFSEYQSGK